MSTKFPFQIVVDDGFFIVLGICFFLPFILLRLKIIFDTISEPRLLDILFIRPLKLRSSKRYFMERFGPAFFMLPGYCVECEKKPVIETVTAEWARNSINRSIAEGDPSLVLKAGDPIPICPDCNLYMNVSSWDRFRTSFLGGHTTLEEFEESEIIQYSNEIFVSETLNQKS